MNEQQNNLKEKFGDLLARNYRRLEVLGAALVLLVFALQFAGVGGINTFLGVSLTFLAIIHFLGAYIPIEYDNLFGIVGSKVVHISSSITLVGVMYANLILPGAAQMLMIGCSSLAIGLTLLIVLWMKNKQEAYLPVLLRGACVLLLGLCFVL